MQELGETYGAYISRLDFDTRGDRVLILFGYPQVISQEERRATLFAQELLEFLRKEGITGRLGIHTGNLYVGPIGSRIRREYTVMGDCVNVTARLASLSNPNQILLSDARCGRIAPFFNMEPMGPIQLKGKRQPQTLYILRSKKIAQRRGVERWVRESHTLVGRDREIRQFLKILDHVREGNGQIAGVTGAAGVGKSRLIRECIHRMRQRGMRVWMGGCQSFSQALPYHPWGEILQTILGFAPTDSPDTRQRKIESYLFQVDLDLKEWAPLLADVVGVSLPETSLIRNMDIKIRRQRTWDLILEILKHESQRRPLGGVLEDLHWADEVSLRLLDYIGQNLTDLPILILFGSRVTRPPLECIQQDNAHIFKLTELSARHTLRLLRSLLDVLTLPRSLERIILTQSQGNPFFVEEIVKSLIELGYIREKNGTYHFDKDFQPHVLPDTVEEVILSRIDTLSPLSRDVLQVASVLGRVFDYALLTEIYPNPHVLDSVLEDLQALDFVIVHIEGGHKRGVFKHILTQEVAYSTLSFARRKEIHHAVVNSLERRVKDEPGIQGILSLVWAVEAGEQARRVYDIQAAVDLFTRAIHSYEKLKFQETFRSPREEQRKIP